MTRLTSIFPLLLIAVVSASAGAWNETGHRLSAMVAWTQLDQAQRDDLIARLRAHPRFKEDFLLSMPDDVRHGGVAMRDRWLFTQAAVWSDLVKSFEGEDRQQYNHSSWHYINEPVFLTEADAKAFTRADGSIEVPSNRSRQWSPDASPHGLNIMQALRGARTGMRDEARSPADKAIDLCWIAHLVADLHQPLHSCALYARRGFPEGDRGGNLVRVVGSDNLHAFWDAALGNVRSFTAQSRMVTRWSRTSELIRSARVAAAETDPEAWLRESLEHARTAAYAPEVRQAVVAQEEALDGTATLAAGTREITLSAEYKRRANEVAIQRAIVAGYRLARMLKDLIRTAENP